MEREQKQGICLEKEKKGSSLEEALGSRSDW